MLWLNHGNGFWSAESILSPTSVHPWFPISEYHPPIIKPSLIAGIFVLLFLLLDRLIHLLFWLRLYL
jgi:hypothetical protein